MPVRSHCFSSAKAFPHEHTKSAYTFKYLSMGRAKVTFHSFRSHLPLVPVILAHKYRLVRNRKKMPQTMESTKQKQGLIVVFAIILQCF